MITRGSEWRRWEPHIHTPGTVLNNGFGGENPWPSYITALENNEPTIGALAVTDYYVTENYEEVLRHKIDGRLAGVDLIFPNIEVRLDVAARSGFVNLHLLVCPDDSDHLDQIKRILARLQLIAHGDTFNCTRDDLIRLGKRANTALTHDHLALAHGVTQFKVNFAKLREVIGASDWAKANILIAVAGGEGDGTSGLKQAADATIREEIEKFAHVIFSGNPAQRQFWLGQRGLTEQQIIARYSGCKPCLHGSDSHSHATIGQPHQSRFTWIKGALSFDALRQACIDPADRAWVGEEPPRFIMPSQVIEQVEITGAPWASVPVIPLNSGLVAIIGARGSGKTALADMIAAGCDAISERAWSGDEDVSPSFLVRARPLLGDAAVTLKWAGGTNITRRLDGRDANSPTSYSRARYLSQQFVEELCSAKGASEGLIREIERVIFEAHDSEECEGAIDFEQLKDIKTYHCLQSREHEIESIGAISAHISTELEKESSLKTLENQVAQKKAQIKSFTDDLSKLVIKGTEEQAKRHAELNAAAQSINSKVQRFVTQRRTFEAMEAEVKNTRTSVSPEMLRQAKQKYTSSGLDQEQWEAFQLVYKGDVDRALKSYIAWANGEIAKLVGSIPEDLDPSAPVFNGSAALDTIPLALIKAEMTRLEKLIGANDLVRRQYTTLSGRIAQENAALQILEERFRDAQEAPARRKALQSERDAAYGRLFDSIVKEQTALAELYAPLTKRLLASAGTLGKLRFSVRRVVDARAWGEFAEEELIDCRKAGPFYGRESLIKIVERDLAPVWQTGTAEEVQAAMTKFILDYAGSLLSHAPYGQNEQLEFRRWLQQFVSWLFDTKHISIKYEMTYEGIDLRNLSPGTRGIVLLLLYLALDELDERPLIIDQPEENLDPKSVFTELVSLFKSAKSKRQVIIVTHNANLVVNTNADQIIVAECSAREGVGLPVIAYEAGGLEDESIRKQVCDILEGGVEAFKERARRLRVRLER